MDQRKQQKNKRYYEQLRDIKNHLFQLQKLAKENKEQDESLTQYWNGVEDIAEVLLVQYFGKTPKTAEEAYDQSQIIKITKQ